MKNSFWFGSGLTLSILMVSFCFMYAGATRGEIAIGGEVFMIALPLMIICNKMNKLQEKLNRKSRYIEQLEEKLNV